MNEVKRLLLKKYAGKLPEIAGRAFDPAAEDFCRATEPAVISLYPWDESGYTPEARAYVARVPGGLQVLMCAREQTIAAVETQFGGAVCRDSCLEFFLNARPEQGEHYLNFEVNAAGVAHIGSGESRYNRHVYAAAPHGMRFQASAHAGGWWAVAYRIPDALLYAEFGDAPLGEMKANFYTCDETLHPHYGCWNPVRAAQPDFHRPECFGLLIPED